MTPAQTRLIDALGAVLPVGRIVTQRDRIEPWETDWRRRFHGHAPALLEPETTADVAACLAAAAAHGVPLVPQGGNSSMVGGATPPADGSAILLSTRRLNRVRAIGAAAGLAVAPAFVATDTYKGHGIRPFVAQRYAALAPDDAAHIATYLDPAVEALFDLPAVHVADDAAAA